MSVVGLITGNIGAERMATSSSGGQPGTQKEAVTAKRINATRAEAEVMIEMP
jgi:hypothetical protein